MVSLTPEGVSYRRLAELRAGIAKARAGIRPRRWGGMGVDFSTGKKWRGFWWGCVAEWWGGGMLGGN